MTENVTEEKPKLDQVFDLLKDGNKTPRTFYELAHNVFTKQEVERDNGEMLARLYTNMNVDGRFLSLGNNFWGLRSWYPIEQREEDVAKTLAPSRKNKTANDGFDDYDDYEDEELDEDLELDEDYDDDEVDEEENDFDDFSSLDDDTEDTDDDTIKQIKGHHIDLDDEE
ncbi:DNA-directed RNA polymerase subunit delta [Terrilactibacillus laevilacticus]|uniref:RNAP delta factor n=1 Tax=Terrilactibacillus laevilacticus TaxID=1380157 RepID=A0ABW5PN16_9BACI|nr:DNA-directed RNA polymerase subunit delta [Terrilactibacillus laevilacticus]